eukprot:10087266-Prorocentrum_lima.AAC.1
MIETLDLSQTTALMLLEEVVEFLAAGVSRLEQIVVITRARPRHDVDASGPLQAWFSRFAARWSASGLHISLRIDPAVHTRR